MRKYGKWIDRETWIKLVAKDRNVGQRQAWTIILKESKSKKHVYQDRTTSYGLPEFGPPVAKEEHTTIIQQFPKPGLLTRVTGWLSSFLDRKAERKDRESRIRKYRIAVGWQKIWLCRQDLNDDEFMSRLGKTKANLQKQYGLEYDYT